MDIPDTRIVFGSAVRCEMVMGFKVDDSNRREEDSHGRRVVNDKAIPEKGVGIGPRGPRSLEEVCREWFEEVRK